MAKRRSANISRTSSPASKANEHRERREELYKQYDAAEEIKKSEMAALRRFEITGGDRVDIGYKSSGWNEYQSILRQKMAFLRKANIHRADHMANALNKMGFKTGSGRQWSPRLIKIAKELLKESRRA